MSPARKKAARKKVAKKAAKKVAKKKAAKKVAAKKTAKKAAKKVAAKKTAKKVAKKAAAPAKKAPAKKAAAKKAPAKEAAADKKKAPAKKKKAARKTKAQQAAAPVATSPHGVKYTCFECGTKFYDLNRPEPICPKCGADQRNRPKPTRKSSAAADGLRAAVRPMAPLLDDDDDSTTRTETVEDVGIAGATPRPGVDGADDLFDDAAVEAEVEIEED